MRYYEDAVYIKMCETCGLEWTPEMGMWVVGKWHTRATLIWAIEGQHIYLACDKATPCNTYTNTKDKLFPLWSQEQLQGMVDFRNMFELHLAFHKFMMVQTDIPFSMPQLWLRFIMKQLHNKKWTGERWEATG